MEGEGGSTLSSLEILPDVTCIPGFLFVKPIGMTSRSAAHMRRQHLLSIEIGSITTRVPFHLQDSMCLDGAQTRPILHRTMCGAGNGSKACNGSTPATLISGTFSIHIVVSSAQCSPCRSSISWNKPDGRWPISLIRSDHAEGAWVTGTISAMADVVVRRSVVSEPYLHLTGRVLAIHGSLSRSRLVYLVDVWFTSGD